MIVWWIELKAVRDHQIVIGGCVGCVSKISDKKKSCRFWKGYAVPGLCWSHSSLSWLRLPLLSNDLYSLQHNSLCYHWVSKLQHYIEKALRWATFVALRNKWINISTKAGKSNQLIYIPPLKFITCPTFWRDALTLCIIIYPIVRGIYSCKFPTFRVGRQFSQNWNPGRNSGGNNKNVCIKWGRSLTVW